MNDTDDELVFVPLGGLGEIGMNLALYGLGPKQRRQWLMVDCGLTFSEPEHVGIEIILPDPAFIESIRRDLLGLVITHAHEDHIGAIVDLWPRFKCPIYATPFAAGVFAARFEAESNALGIEIKSVVQRARIALGPFEV